MIKLFTAFIIGYFTGVLACAFAKSGYEERENESKQN